MTTPPISDPPASQANNPLHGITLQAMLVALSGHYGWAGLGERIALRCFTHEPSVTS
ncbi:MAG TPA: VF530 family DNA-binding protein, partial [Rhodoferax sp.]|nr:VF530 family DNA-binding protein [Rhodoferax sp.]